MDLAQRDCNSIGQIHLVQYIVQQRPLLETIRNVRVLKKGEEFTDRPSENKLLK